jgi:hypothetical protein
MRIQWESIKGITSICIAVAYIDGCIGPISSADIIALGWILACNLVCVSLRGSIH